MRDIYYIAPKAYREFFKSQIMYAGIKEAIAHRLVGISFIMSIALFAILSPILVFTGFGLIGLLIGTGIGGAVILFTYLFFMLIADSRANQIETVLPDALQLISANVRAGMTIDRAIWLAARPEFGVLEEEIKMVGARTMGGKSLKIALTDMTKNIKSSILDRTIKLLLEGIESGGELAHLLEEVAANVRTTQTLKKEIKSSVMTYSIFILFAAVIAAPFLFSISIFFVDTMTTIWGSVNIGGASVTGSPMGMGMLAKARGPQITVDELFWFAVVALSVSSFFGSMTIGLIQSGKEKSGLKLIPVMVGVSITILLLGLTIIRIMFKGFFTI